MKYIGLNLSWIKVLWNWAQGWISSIILVVYRCTYYISTYGIFLTLVAIGQFIYLGKLSLLGHVNEMASWSKCTL